MAKPTVGMTTPNWLGWAQRLQALAQTGLEYANNEFDKDRYMQIRTIAAEIMAEGSGETLERVHGLFADQAGYTTPKVDVRGVVFRDNKVLMVREKLDGGRWTLPGGWADVGEAPSLATEREIQEEAGFRARAVKLLALYDRAKQGHPPIAFYTYKVYFLCELLDNAQNLVPNVETEESGWFGDDEIPELSIGRVTEAQIHRFFEHLRHPDWPTDFD
jgi:ADP-ribose pyrophosphatase YjhB (NUDIX family)